MVADQSVPIFRLMDVTVRVGSSIDSRAAAVPTSTTPVSSKPTTAGVVVSPSAFGITIDSPSWYTAIVAREMLRSMATERGTPRPTLGGGAAGGRQERLRTRPSRSPAPTWL